MRIGVYGAGAIGGYLAWKLANAGHDVSVVARGAHLEAIINNGLTLIEDDTNDVVSVSAANSGTQLGSQDVVFITLKAHSIPAAAADIAAMCNDDTSIIPAVNGVPWWYFYRLAGEFEDRRVQIVDPDDAQWTHLDPARTIGCVVYPSCEILEPGVIKHISGDRFSLGEPSGEKSTRVTEVSRALREAGLKAPVKTRIRDEIWVKLWGNVAFNPVSALTGATLDMICGDPDLHAVCRAAMLEAKAIGEALGAGFAIDVDQRIAGAAAVGAHKTSMLQDLEQGRPMEIDAIVGAVRELGSIVKIETPTIDQLFALVVARARTAGCYR